VVGLVVAVPVPPPVAVMPINAGMEKNVLAHASGAAEVMSASSLSVTVSGLLALPLAATVIGVVSVCVLPLVAVAKFHPTSLGVVARHPAWVVVNALEVYPVAYVVLVGSCTAVIVTGKSLALMMLTTTSPLSPGSRRSPGAVLDTALMVSLEMVADWASPEELLVNPTTQFVTPYAATPTTTMPSVSETPLLSQESFRPFGFATACRPAPVAPNRIEPKEAFQN
jgi:hypothetical protein